MNAMSALPAAALQLVDPPNVHRVSEVRRLRKSPPENGARSRQSKPGRQVLCTSQPAVESMNEAVSRIKRTALGDDVGILLDFGPASFWQQQVARGRPRGPVHRWGNWEHLWEPTDICSPGPQGGNPFPLEVAGEDGTLQTGGRASARRPTGAARGRLHVWPAGELGPGQRARPFPSMMSPTVAATLVWRQLSSGCPPPRRRILFASRLGLCGWPGSWLHISFSAKAGAERASAHAQGPREVGDATETGFQHFERLVMSSEVFRRGVATDPHESFVPLPLTV